MSTRRNRTFTVTEYVNRGGSVAYRVNGWEGNKRVRENYKSEEFARARRNELETLWLGSTTPVVRAVDFPESFQRAASAAFMINPDPKALMAAVQFWNSPARQSLYASADAPKLDEAFRQYAEWMASPKCGLRSATRNSYKTTLRTFVLAMGNMPLADLSSDLIHAYLEKKWESRATQNTARLMLSAFFVWCEARPREWLKVNPASGKLIVIQKDAAKLPQVLTPLQVLRLLAAARRVEGGKFLSFVVRQLFCGMRPAEALRLNWGNVNVTDGELHLDAHETKTGKPRTVFLDPVALAWLKLSGPSIQEPRGRHGWTRIKRLARLKDWPADVLRHTAITYKFRANGSYGRTAEWAGNSEAIIKAHYQGRGVTSVDATKYWALFPDRQQRKTALKEATTKVIEFKAAA